MNSHTGQTSSQTEPLSNELQLAVHKQQNKRLIRDIKPVEATHFQNADKPNLL